MQLIYRNQRKSENTNFTTKTLDSNIKKAKNATDGQKLQLTLKGPIELFPKNAQFSVLCHTV